jgi:protein HOOK3
LARTAQEATQSSRESANLKDKLKEFQHLADTLQKTEALNEKYKKKLEDAADMREKVKLLESDNVSLRSKHADYETELGKLKSYKPLLDSCRDQLKDSEDKASELLMQGSKVEFEMREIRFKMVRMEAEKKAAQELNENLEERLRDLEEGEGLVISCGTLAGELEGGETDPAPQILYDCISLTPRRRKVSTLERQLDKYKSGVNGIRVDMLESMLEDSEKLKCRFEDDYLNLYQRNLALENEIKKLTSDSGYLLILTKSSRSQSLHLSLAEKEQEITALIRIIAESSDPASQASQMQEKLAKSYALIEANKTQSRILEAKINKLTQEKEGLVEQALDLKDRLSGESKAAGELRAIVAGFESEERGEDGGSLAAATHKLVNLQQQNDALHQALKQAKEVSRVLFICSENRHEREGD